MNNKKLTEEAKEHAIRYRDFIYDQNSFAEAKNGVLLTLVGVVFGVLINILEKQTIDNELLEIYLLIVIVGFILSFLLSLWSFIPKLLKVKKTKVSNNNLYYFGYIKTLNSDTLKLKLETEDVFNHLLEQNIEMSKIVDRKFKLFNLAVKVFLCSIIPLFIIMLIIIKIYKNIETKEVI